jgi:hypothetical protein
MPGVVKRGLLILIVLLVVVTGLPILMGPGAMAACPECGPTVLVSAAACLLALTVTSAWALALLLVTSLRLRHDRLPAWVFARLLERPPRLA